jgi:hypothetical protein
MSQANAAAIKRRANPQTNNSPAQLNRQPTNDQRITNSSALQSVNAPGLTLPQVIALIDQRLTNLETSKKEDTVSLDIGGGIIEEFNARFEILAEELSNLKDIVLKLQSYTMEVNKSLLEERIQIFSEIGTNTNMIETETITADARDVAHVYESKNVDEDPNVPSCFSLDV